jgi:hypothetical protein
LHLAALLRSFEFAELNRQGLFRSANDFHLIEGGCSQREQCELRLW